ncbi:MAG: hypothetical protein GX647_04480 [Clostridiales bacterium]|nr:hypothetical protein [Clostridiales bacterium]
MGNKLTARQKRAVFESHFSEKLLAEDFSLVGGSFCRLHQGQVMLFTNLYLSSSGEGQIHFDAVPFCIGVTKGLKTIPSTVNHLVELRYREELKKLKPCEYFDIVRAMSFEEKFEYLYREYFGELFERFNVVTDVKKLLDFQAWQYRFVGHNLREKWKMLECLQLKRYEEARHFAELYHARIEFAMRRDGEVYDYGMKGAANKRQKEETQAQYEAVTSSRNERIEDIDEWIHLMATCQYKELSDKIQGNIETSAATFREIYPSLV